MANKHAQPFKLTDESLQGSRFLMEMEDTGLPTFVFYRPGRWHPIACTQRFPPMVDAEGNLLWTPMVQATF
jgi:hypothetical protein